MSKVDDVDYFDQPRSRSDLSRRPRAKFFNEGCFSLCLSLRVLTSVATIMKDTNSGGAVNAVSQGLHGCSLHHFSIKGVGIFCGADGCRFWTFSSSISSDRSTDYLMRNDLI